MSAIHRTTLHLSKDKWHAINGMRSRCNSWTAYQTGASTVTHMPCIYSKFDPHLHSLSLCHCHCHMPWKKRERKRVLVAFGLCPGLTCACVVSAFILLYSALAPIPWGSSRERQGNKSDPSLEKRTLFPLPTSAHVIKPPNPQKAQGPASSIIPFASSTPQELAVTSLLPFALLQCCQSWPPSNEQAPGTLQARVNHNLAPKSTPGR